MKVDEIEASGAIKQQMAGALGDALDALDLHQEVEFQIYTRLVLPVDGYVFWQPIGKEKVKGALHITQEIVQNEDETYGAGTVAFSTQEPVVQFNQQPIDHLWVAEHDGIRFAFPQQQGFLSAAGLWHYFGPVLSPILAYQLLDSEDRIDPTRAIVSNSLPLWLQLNGWQPPFVTSFRKSGFLLYPKDLVPPNLPPPYGTVDIDEDQTEALQAFALTDPATSSTYQLLADQVRIKLFGLQSDEAEDFFRLVIKYASPEGTQNFGLMNAPRLVDVSRKKSPALQAVAMVKQIDFRVAYYQSRVREVAMDLLKSAAVSLYVQQSNGSYLQIPPYQPTSRL